METCLRTLNKIAAARGGASGMRVVEIGCGRGEFSERLHALGHEIIGMDMKPDRVAGARERTGKKNMFMVGDLTHMPLRDASCDFVIANFVFEHVPEYRKGFAEVIRVLRPGGAFYVSVPNRFSPMEGHIPLLFPHWLPPGRPRRLYISVLAKKDGAAWDRAIASHNYWTHGSLEKLLLEYFNRVEIRTLERYACGDFQGLKHRLLRAAMRAPLLGAAARAAVLTFGNIEIIARKS